MTSRARMFTRFSRRHPAIVLGLVLTLVLILVATLAPVISPYQPNELNLSNRLSPPTGHHLLGTDEFGRDILSRIIYGARASLQVGVITVVIAGVLGTILGVTAAYYGGVIDNLIMRLIDMILAFPTILLALVVITALGPSLTNLMIAMGIVYTPQFARIARGSALSVKSSEFIESARAVGAGSARINRLHILPNILSPLLVQATISIAFAILAEAALSFLGLGIQPPMPSWGSMLNEGRTYMELSAWLVIAPGLAIMLTVLTFNFLGDALRDYLDPRLVHS
ncbi:MAG: ABC transporter permease [Trueperaceae bacterium]